MTYNMAEDESKNLKSTKGRKVPPLVGKTRHAAKEKTTKKDK